MADLNEARCFAFPIPAAGCDIYAVRNTKAVPTSRDQEWEQAFKTLREKGWLQAVQELGDLGWELCSAPQRSEDGGLLIDAKRGQSELGTWEYHIFQLYGQYYGWGDRWDSPWDLHIASCGWVRLEPALHHYNCMYTFLFKRSQQWRGTDDGDIPARLRDLGCTSEDLDRLDPEWGGYADGVSHFNGALQQVLRLKWDESRRNGYNVGTYHAARLWILQCYVPKILNSFGITPGALRPEELLGTWLDLRQAGREKAFTPTLMRAAKSWADAREAVS